MNSNDPKYIPGIFWIGIIGQVITYFIQFSMTLPLIVIYFPGILALGCFAYLCLYFSANPRVVYEDEIECDDPTMKFFTDEEREMNNR